MCIRFSSQAVAGLVLLAALSTSATAFAAESDDETNAPAKSSSGWIKGVVRDAKSGEAIENALVLIECTCLKSPVEVYTSANGVFAASKLPQGHYTIAIVYGQGLKKFDARLDNGQVKTFRVKLNTQDVRDVRVTSPVRRDPVRGFKLKGEELGKMASGGVGGGAYQAVLDADPHGSSDAGGQTTLGHTSAEMDYRVNGANVNDPALNRPMIQPVQEFIDSVEVQGSGYDAEFGGYVGGIVEARRTSGGNVMRGQARFSFIPRLAKPRFSIRTDDAVRAREVFDYQMQGVLSLSGPIIKDRLFWSAGVMAIGTKSRLIQTFHAREDRDGSGGYEACPYENGDNDCVAGGNYIASRKFAEQTFPTSAVSAQVFGGIDWQINPKHRIEVSTFLQPSFVRRSYRRPVNLNNLDPDFLGANATANPVSGGSTVANGVVNGVFGWDRINAVNTSLAYKGRVADDKLEIDAGVSYFQSKYVEAWRLDDPSLKTTPATQSFDSQGRNLFQLLDAEKRLDLAGNVDEACNHPDLPPGQTCPVRSWMSGGIGQYQQSRSRRVGGNIALTHFFNAQGSHQLKYGAQIEHSERKRRLTYSGNNEGDFFSDCGPGQTDGGEYCYSPGGGYAIDRGLRVNNNRLVLVDLDNPNARSTLGYGRIRSEEGNLRAIASPIGAGIRAPYYEGTVSSQSYGLFIRDRWSILSNLALNLGVRWDMQDMRDVLGRRAIFLWDNVAPRASAVYDWTNEGKSRLYASYGWFYQTLPLSLLNRVYGGQVNVVRNFRENVCDGPIAVSDGMGGIDNKERFVEGQPTEYCTDTNASTTGLTEGATVPNLKGQYEQQFTLGYDQEVIEDLVLGVSWLHNDLGRAVEDVSTNGGQDFVIANPGTPVSGDEMANQRATCDRLDSELAGLGLDDPRRQQVAREVQRCEFLVDAYQKVGELFDRPRRTTDAFTFMVDKRLAKNWRLIGSYTFNRQIGNYDGFVDPVTGAVNLGGSIQYDTPELVRNSFGHLAFSSPHRFKLDGFYTFDLDRAGSLVLGAALRVNSGFPISLRAGSSRHPTGIYPIYVLPRGAGGRLEPNYQVNLTLQYAYPILAYRNKKKREDGEVPQAMMLGVGARLYNVTNAKAVLRVDEVYSLENTRAIAGGALSDLKHAKVQSATNPTEFFQREILEPQGNFGVEAAFQTPLAAQFDVQLLF